MSLKLLVFGDLLNLDRACLRCLVASLQSSLYHGLLLVGFSLGNTFFRYFNKRGGKISYRIRRFFEVFWH